jgi:hypothetical protein
LQNFGDGSLYAEAGRDRDEHGDDYQHCHDKGDERQRRRERRHAGTIPGGGVEADPGRNAEQGSEESREELGEGQTGGDLLGRSS